MSDRRVNVGIWACLLFSIIAPLVYLLSVIVMGAISAIIIITTIVLLPSFYLLIKRTMDRSRLRVRNPTTSSTNVVESKVNQNVIIVIVVYFLCAFDLFIVTCLFLFIKYDSTHMRVGIFMMSANSTLNPIIYVLRDTSFKRKLRVLFFREQEPEFRISTTRTNNRRNVQSDANIQVIQIQSQTTNNVSRTTK